MVCSKLDVQNQFTLETCSNQPVLVSKLGTVAYADSYEAMAMFTAERSDSELDQIWLLEHVPVYTQGTACKMTTVLPSSIPVVKTDRGGQITYHGPGQLVMYPLLKLKRYGVGVKALVAALEQSVIDTLLEYHIDAGRRPDAPGVYVDEQKIAALGLRIRNGSSYHGLSLNVDMDLQPFSNIDPCGYQGLRITQLSDFTSDVSIEEVSERLLSNFVALI